MSAQQKKIGVNDQVPVPVTQNMAKSSTLQSIPSKGILNKGKKTKPKTNQTVLSNFLEELRVNPIQTSRVRKKKRRKRTPQPTQTMSKSSTLQSIPSKGIFNKEKKNKSKTNEMVLLSFLEQLRVNPIQPLRVRQNKKQKKISKTKDQTNQTLKVRSSRQKNQDYD